MHNIFTIIFFAFVFLPASVLAEDIKVFPPEGICSGADHALTWDGISSVKCKTAAEILGSFDCKAGEFLVVDSDGGIKCGTASGETESFAVDARVVRGCSTFRNGDINCDGATCHDPYTKKADGTFIEKNYFVVNHDGDYIYDSNGQRRPTGIENNPNTYYGCEGIDLNTGKKDLLFLKAGEVFAAVCETKNGKTGRCSCSEGKTATIGKVQTGYGSTKHNTVMVTCSGG